MGLKVIWVYMTSANSLPSEHCAFSFVWVGWVGKGSGNRKEGKGEGRESEREREIENTREGGHTGVHKRKGDAKPTTTPRWILTALSRKERKRTQRGVKPTVIVGRG